METASLILGVLGMLFSCVGIGIIPSIIGFVLGIMSYKKKDNSKKSAGIVGLVTSSVGLMVGSFAIIVILFGEVQPSEEQNSSTYYVEESQETTEESVETDAETEAETQKETEESVDLETDNIDVETIFYGEIGLNKDYYMGKEAAFSFKCDKDNDEKIDELSTESNLCYGGLKVLFEEEQQVSINEYITVYGTVGEDHGATALKDSVILARGEKAEENYNRELEAFKQSFLDAESVSYEELLRYPDTYKDKKVKIELDITEVESDGAIFNGTVTGVVPGTEDEVALYDYRENREPRIREGDKLIIYGVGNKTVTVKVKDGEGLFAKTIDEYYIPCLYIQYINFR